MSTTPSDKVLEAVLTLERQAGFNPTQQDIAEIMKPSNHINHIVDRLDRKLRADG